MLRKQILRKIFTTTFIFFILFVLSNFTYNDNLPNIKVDYQNKLSKAYFLNANDYLVESSILIEDDLYLNINKIIDSLKNNHKYYNSLRGIIPNNTKINDIKVKDEILEIDFNQELLNINALYEEKVIESLVFSLLNLKGINGIKISINGEPLKILPKTNIRLDDILTKDFGINKEYSITSLNDIKKVVVYYYQVIDNEKYFVPVTKYVNSSNDKIKIIIDNLKSSYLYETNLLSYLNDKISIEKYEYNDRIVTLSFNNLYDINNNYLEEELIYSVSNSIFLSTDMVSVIFACNDDIITIRGK